MSIETLPDTLPHSEDAERSVLGAVLLDNQQFHEVQEILTHEAFYSSRHRKIFRALEEMVENGTALDLITLNAELDRAGDLDSCGGTAYLSSLLDGVSRSGNVRHYAEIVKQKSTLRDLIHAAQWIQSTALEGRSPSDEIVDEAEKRVFRVAQGRLRRGFVPIKETAEVSLKLLAELNERKESVTGIPTGFVELDEKTAGFQNSDLIVLAARPSMGKTAIALNIAVTAARKHHKTVGLFSLEMAQSQLFFRMLCSEAKVDAHLLRTGRADEEEWDRILEVMHELSACPIYIDDSAGINLFEVRAKARRLQHERGLDLLIIDYLQLMRGTGRYESRQQEISDISRSLKELAKELNVPVLALSQLSRAPEQRTGDRRPQLSDLRESGAIEQDADVVLFLFREELYKKDDPELRGKAELIIGKQRNGPVGVVELYFIREFNRFENLAWRET